MSSAEKEKYEELIETMNRYGLTFDDVISIINECEGE